MSTIFTKIINREITGIRLIRIKKEVEGIGCIEKRRLRSFLDRNIHLCLGFASNFIYYGVEKRIHSTEFIVWSVEDIIVLNYKKNKTEIKILTLNDLELV